MKVVVHPADDGGCGHYRLIFPTTVLADQGHDVHLESEHLYRAIWQPSPFGDRVVGLDETIDADVVVMQRPLHRNRVELIGVLQKAGAAVVVEVDDDFHSIHQRNPAYAQTDPLQNRDHNRDWLARACERADLVTVSTPALAARYGAHGRVAILPNFVPASYLTIEHHDGDGSLPIVGWSGSTRTHPGDLEVTKGAVARAVAAAGARFAVVGTGDGVRQALRLDVEPAAAGWQPIDQYPHAVASFDIGVVPLRMSAFNEAKSNLKMSEMAAVGAAPIGSPTGENRQLVAAGAGLLADTPAAWYETVHELATDRGLRDAVAFQAREVMRGRTYETQAWRWLEAWDQAVANRHGRVAA